MKNDSIAARFGGRSITFKIARADLPAFEAYTGAGTIVKVSVEQSLKATKQQMPGLMANAQARNG